MENKGLIHIYCGDGKGKTTAAIGLALRCAGGGGRVMVYQFLKNGKSGEIKALKAVEGIEVIKGLEKVKFSFDMTRAEELEIKEFYTAAFKEIVKGTAGKGYDMLVLDEIFHCVNLGYIPLEGLMEFLNTKPYGLEVIMTGRNPHKALVEAADYVSEIIKIKHPFDRGVNARKYIEY